MLYEVTPFLAIIGLFFGNMFSICFSIAGALVSFIGMVLLKSTKRISMITVAIIGGVLHNVGQIIIASVILKNVGIFTYVPILMIAGIITGTVIGILSNILYKKNKESTLNYRQYGFTRRFFIMISYISGVVEEIEKDKVVVDNNGIGYGIFASQSTLEQIGIGEQVKIYTYFSVREDAMQLYGFLSRQELQLFKLLIGVSGVGPKGGLAILSTCPGDSLSMAVLADDAKAISKAPGIGAKTAQKIIIELKDKIDIEDMIVGETISKPMTKASGAVGDAVEALTALGYSQTMAYQAIKSIENVDGMDVEEILKKALKNIF